ncbi:hypothetical protein FF011L_29040 [Roseimaritima multifibrata]|uniref:Uncharacterized protein n=1 Tax=Roseimaritima multifibrata TaxID=1930274 RepID=A0A517MGX2_9BACT|nr:hypothetical protein FF011L_29040 [Roseimaritima multifibrata]
MVLVTQPEDRIAYRHLTSQISSPVRDRVSSTARVDRVRTLGRSLSRQRSSLYKYLPMTLFRLALLLLCTSITNLL